MTEVEVDIPSPETMQNMDIVDLTNRIDRFLLETARNASATRSETNPHDARRRHEITDRLERRFQLYAADPELDLPKYHPRPLKCPVPPTVLKIENNVLAETETKLDVWFKVNPKPSGMLDFEKGIASQTYKAIKESFSGFIKD